MPVELPVGSILSNQLHVNLANPLCTCLHFDGHVLVGLFQLLVPLLEGGVAFDALLQLRFHLPRPLDLLPEIRSLFMYCSGSDREADKGFVPSMGLRIHHKGNPERPFIAGILTSLKSVCP